MTSLGTERILTVAASHLGPLSQSVIDRQRKRRCDSTGRQVLKRLLALGLASVFALIAILRSFAATRRRIAPTSPLWAAVCMSRKGERKHTSFVFLL